MLHISPQARAHSYDHRRRRPRRHHHRHHHNERHRRLPPKGSAKVECEERGGRKGKAGAQRAGDQFGETSRCIEMAAAMTRYDLNGKRLISNAARRNATIAPPAPASQSPFARPPSVEANVLRDRATTTSMWTMATARMATMTMGVAMMTTRRRRRSWRWR